MIESLSKSYNNDESKVKCITSDNRTYKRRMPDRIMQTFILSEKYVKKKRSLTNLVDSSF